MTCCSVVVQEETFESLSARWSALLAAQPEPTFFALPSWQRLWWEAFGEGSSLRLLSVAAEEGRIQLIAPLMRTDSVVSFLGGTDLVDYHDFIGAPESARECLEAVLREIGSNESIRRIELGSVAEDSPTMSAFPEAAKSAGWAVEIVPEDVAPRVHLSTDWDEYLAGLRKKDRHELRRKLRRIDAAGEVNHVELTTPEDIAAAIDDFTALHRMSTVEKSEFMTSEREAFFKKVAVELAMDRLTRLCFLEFDGQRVATSLSFVLSGVRYLYNSGYNPEYRHLSVGLLNHAYNIRRSIDEGLAVFDFMRGDEPYKYHLGGRDRQLCTVTATR